MCSLSPALAAAGSVVSTRCTATLLDSQRGGAIAVQTSAGQSKGMSAYSQVWLRTASARPSVDRYRPSALAAAPFSWLSSSVRFGCSAGTGNVLANSVLFRGVSVRAGTGTAILGNSIYGNQTVGIDLNNDAVTLNDTGDADAGPNNLQNFPVLTLALKLGRYKLGR